MFKLKQNSAAATALLLALGACGAEPEEETPPNEPGAGEYVEEAASSVGDALEDTGETVAQGVENTAETIGALADKEIDEFNALGLTARNILGEEVRTRTGVVAAHIDDILFAQQDGRPVIAVLREGGLFGAGADRVVVTIQRLIIIQDQAGEISVEVTMSDEELEALGNEVAYLPADFSVAGDIDTSLLSASKLLDTAVYNSANQKIADTYDLILDRQWKIESIVLSTGGLANLGDRLVRMDWTMFALTEDNAALRMAQTSVDFDTLPAFTYETLQSTDQ